ncbi:MAG: peroxiredoxin-like family protein [Synechococcus sp.]
MDVRACLSQTQLQCVGDGELSPFLPSFPTSTPLLLLIWPQLGDFDSLEYAWWIHKEREFLDARNLSIRAVGIGDRASGERFCAFTRFPTSDLWVDPTANLHRLLGLYAGLSFKLPGGSPSTNAYLNLLLMCAGIGSPGTLKEVFRGYRGDQQAPQLIEDDEVVKATPLLPIKGSFFRFAGGKGFQRPFELATLRLRNMAEVLGHWSAYIPNAAYLTQRGATFLFDPQGTLLYEYRARNLLGFAPNMNQPLSFLADRLEQQTKQPEQKSTSDKTVTLG